MFFITAVRDTVTPKWHIPNGYVKKAIREGCFFIAFYLDVGIRIQELCNPAADTVNFYPVQPGALHCFREHSKEIPGRHGRFQYLPFP